MLVGLEIEEALDELRNTCEALESLTLAGNPIKESS